MINKMELTRNDFSDAIGRFIKSYAVTYETDVIKANSSYSFYLLSIRDRYTYTRLWSFNEKRQQQQQTEWVNFY